MSKHYTDADVQAFNEWLGIGPNAAKNVLDKIAPTMAARAIREFATDRVTTQTAARMREDLFDYADEIEAGQP